MADLRELEGIPEKNGLLSDGQTRKKYQVYDLMGE